MYASLLLARLSGTPEGATMLIAHAHAEVAKAKATNRVKCSYEDLVM